MKIKSKIPLEQRLLYFFDLIDQDYIVYYNGHPALDSLTTLDSLTVLDTQSIVLQSVWCDHIVGAHIHIPGSDQRTRLVPCGAGVVDESSFDHFL